MPKFIDTILTFLSNFAFGKAIPSIIIAVVGFIAILVAMRVIKAVLNKSKLEPVAHNLICSLVRTVMIALLCLIVASRLGVDVTGIVALASVLTLAVSLAMQNVLSNVMGGFTLLYTKPFRSGDFVEIGGQSGTVKEIGLTYTKIITPDNKTVAIPNSIVSSGQIINYTAVGTRRVDITVSASYDAPTDKVLEVLKDAANVPTILADQEIFTAVLNYGESAIEYAVRVWCNADDYWTTMFTINHAIKHAFDQAGIAMTYPHLNVHLDK